MLRVLSVYTFYFTSIKLSLLLQELAAEADNKNVVFLKVDVDDAGVCGL